MSSKEFETFWQSVPHQEQSPKAWAKMGWEAKLDTLKKELDVIDNAQRALWKLSHLIKRDNEYFGEQVWQLSLQIESALLHINQEIYGKDEYWGEE